MPCCSMTCVQLCAAVSAVGATSALFLLPCFFAVLILDLHFLEKWFCLLLSVGSIVLSGIGFYASLESLAHKGAD